MESEGRPNRENITNTVVVIFAHSKLKDLVGTDAMTTVLVGQYRDLVYQDTMHLQLIWDLLEEQPGFVAEDASAPFCALKMLEEKLQLEVEMPGALADYDSTRIMATASHCVVPKGLIDRTLFPPTANGKAAARAAAEARYQRATSGPAQASTRKPVAEVALAVVALIGLAYGGYTVFSFYQGPQFEAISPSDLITKIPIDSARVLGSDLETVCTDESWYQRPEAERISMMTNTLEALKSNEVEVLIVRDAGGALRASAQWVDGRAEVRLR